MVLEAIYNALNTKYFYIVGGTVRNMIYKNEKSKDIDIIVQMSVEDVLSRLGSGFYSLKINDVIRVKDIPRDSHIDIYCTKDITKDISRRDFIVNSVLYDYKNKSYIVPKKMNYRMLEFIDKDYHQTNKLSLIRAIRISLQCELLLSKGIEYELYNLDISSINKTNLRKEFFLIIQEKMGIETLKKYGILEQIIPQFKKTYGFDQNNIYHDLDLYNHTLKTIEVSDSLEVKVAMLFHDLGKPDSIAEREDGYSSFYGHETLSARIASEWLFEHNVEKSFSETVLNIVRTHMKKSMKMPKMIGQIGVSDSILCAEAFVSDTLGRIEIDSNEEKTMKENLKLLDEEVSKQAEERRNEIDITKPNLIIMVGLPRSGKTSYVKKHYSDYVYISRDDVREKVFGYKGNMNHEEEVSRISNGILKESTDLNKNIVIDNTNIQRKYRKQIIDKHKNKYNIIAIYIDANIKDVKQNAVADDFPMAVIDSMMSRLVVPKYEEGYSKIIHCTPEFAENEILYEEFEV